MGKTVAIEMEEDLYDRFWSMKNDLHPEMGEAINHHQAVAYLMDLYREHGVTSERDPRADACPGCGTAGEGDNVLAQGQRWCPDETCPVVSFLTDDEQFDRLLETWRKDP